MNISGFSNIQNLFTQNNSNSQLSKTGATTQSSTNLSATNNILSKVDTDGDGKISQAELEAITPALSSTNSTTISSLLQSQESDGSNSILNLFGNSSNNGNGISSLVQTMLEKYNIAINNSLSTSATPDSHTTTTKA